MTRRHVLAIDVSDDEHDTLVAAFEGSKKPLRVADGVQLRENLFRRLYLALPAKAGR